MRKYSVLFLVFLCLLAVQLVFEALAKSDIEYSSLNITDFISKAYTPTYDCPIPELLPEIEKRLTTSGLSEQEILSLNSMKTHALICDGRNDEAKSLLNELLANPNADRSSQYYLSAIYQLGFVYDSEEDPTRCKYYKLAKDSSNDVFIDIYLSANLGFISECMSGSMNEKFFAIFELLDFITEVGEPAAIAHAHNRVGILYSNSGRTNLAAEQYMKGFYVAEDVYTSQNLLVLLSNAIINFIASERFDKAKVALDEYSKIRKMVKSDVFKIRESLLLSNYYVSTDDYANLKLVLDRWRELNAKTTNYFHKRLFAVYNAHMCLHNDDKECIKAFMEAESQTSANYQAHMMKALSYRELLVKANIALGNIQDVKESFQQYVDKVKFNQTTKRISASSVNLLELHQEISQLENRLNDEQKVSSKLLLIFTILILLGVVLVIYFWNKKRLERDVFDQQTGLLNEKEVSKRLTNLRKPSGQNTNALVVFNLERLIIQVIGNDSSNYNSLIIDTAQLLKGVTREDDIVGQFGDGKFVICICDVDETKAVSFFERVKSALSNNAIDNYDFTYQQVESCVSVYYSYEKFDNANDILNNMFVSLNMQSA